MAAFLEFLKFYLQASIHINECAQKGITACSGGKHQALVLSFHQVQNKSSDEMVNTIF